MTTLAAIFAFTSKHLALFLLIVQKKSKVLLLLGKTPGYTYNLRTHHTVHACLDTRVLYLVEICRQSLLVMSH